MRHLGPDPEIWILLQSLKMCQRSVGTEKFADNFMHHWLHSISPDQIIGSPNLTHKQAKSFTILWTWVYQAYDSSQPYVLTILHS